MCQANSAHNQPVFTVFGVRTVAQGRRKRSRKKRTFIILHSNNINTGACGNILHSNRVNSIKD